LILVMGLFCLVWGAGFLLLPVQMWSLYGVPLDSQGVYMARMLGVVFFMLGLILWFARNDPGSQSSRAIVLGLFAGNLVGFIVALVGQLSAGISALGWLGVASYLFLGLGFGYFLLKPAGREMRVGPVS
jgi:xanthine/uracil permease